MAGNGVRKGIELIEVGEEWNASSGKVTFTPEHLSAAIAAYDDDAVRDPIIRLGHASILNDGEPALGRIINPRLSADGLTLLGDLAGLPEWLDEGMPTLYPRRSIEGRFNYTTATGKTHLFMLTGVALIGSAYPAITTLEDVQLLMTAESIDDFELVTAVELFDDLVLGTEKGPDRLMAPKKKSTKVAASVAADDVRREFYDSLDSEDYWAQWIRQIYVDPPQLIVSDSRIEPYLLQIPYTTDGANDSVTFREPVRVREVFEPVGDSVAAAEANSGIVVYSTPDESRPAKDRSNDLRLSEGNPMTEEQLKAVGLEAGATQEEYDAKIAELVAAAAQSAEAGEGEGEGAEEETPAPGSPPVVVPQQKTDEAAATTPPVVTVDASAWAENQAEMARLRKIRENIEAKEKDDLVAAAMGKGKFGPVAAKEWRKALDNPNEEVVAATIATINSFPENAVPLAPIGHGKSGEEVNASQEDEYPAAWGGLLSINGGKA